MIFEHVSITVSDLERSIDFYTKVLGFSLLRRTPIHAYLYLNSDLLELMQSDAPIIVDRPKKSGDWIKKMTGPVGLNHIGFRVDDIDEAVGGIRGLGGEVVVQPYRFEPDIVYVAEPTNDKLRRAAKPKDKPYWRIAMVSDPDGVIIEILER
jgi:lactoylglutathione lyase